MSIRIKLLALLLVIALVPLLAGTVVSQTATRSLGGAFVRDSRAFLFRDTRDDLTQIVRSYATYVDRTIEALEVAVRVQADEAATALTAPTDAPPGPFVLAKDLDEGRNAPSDFAPDETYTVYAEGGERTVLSVTRLVQSMVAAPGVGAETVERLGGRLGTMTERYRVLRRMQPDLIYWQFTAAAQGVHASYPGHGGYPPSFDPRARPWYLAAAQAMEESGRPRPAWSPPIIDASTRHAMMTVSHAVTDDEGRLLGVTGIDIRIADILGRIDQWTEGWADNGALFLIVTGVSGETTRPEEVLVFAERHTERDGDSWITPPRLRPLGLGPATSPTGDADEQLDAAERTADPIGRVRAVLTAAGIDAFRATLNGVDVLCVVAPMTESNAEADTSARGRAGVLMAVPVADIVAFADTAETGLLSRMRVQLATNLGILLLVAAAVVIVALGASRSVTRPVAELAETANQIAGGDLEARAPIHTNDEIGRLGEAFNHMVPLLQDRLRMGASLEMAKQVQQRLLPGEPPDLAGLRVAGVSDYCDETGGDYFDFVHLPGGGLGVALGDVTGHGIAAAILMATGRAMLRARLERPAPIAEQIADVNRQLARDASDGKFMTLFYLALAPGQPVRWTSAGHDPAILLRPSGGGAETVDLAGEDIPLAIMPDWDYHEHERPPLAPGETIVIGTDGIWEARNPAGEMFGRQRFLDVLCAHAHADPDALCKAVLEAVTAFRDGHEQLDDITMVAVRAIN